MNSNLFTGSKKFISEIEIIFRKGDEKAICFFNTVGCYLSEMSIFSHAFTCCFVVRDRISSTTMEESMISARSTGGKISLFNQNRRDSSQGQIS